jgi:ABC-type uncharacterized transport system auxiliary subunit
MRLLVILLTGCALTSKAPPVTVRYYIPPLADAAGGDAPAHRTAVRLARVSAASHLGYAIAYRTSPVELQLYDLDRWTDTPEVYARRSLERAIFRDHGFDQVTSDEKLTVDVEVVAFEEQRTPPGGRVSLRYTIRDDERVLVADVATAVRSARSANRADVVVAIGRALDAASDEVADRLEKSVAHPVQPDSPDDVPRHRLSHRR